MGKTFDVGILALYLLFSDYSNSISVIMENAILPFQGD